MNYNICIMAVVVVVSFILLSTVHHFKSSSETHLTSQEHLKMASAPDHVCCLSRRSLVEVSACSQAQHLNNASWACGYCWYPAGGEDGLHRQGVCDLQWV